MSSRNKKTDDENFEKRIFRKKKLDETSSYSVSKIDAVLDDAADYDEILDGQMQFDFDEEDIERFRKINQDADINNQKAKKENKKTRIFGHKTKESSIMPESDPDVSEDAEDDSDADQMQDDPDKTTYNIADKRRTNKEIMRVTYLMMIMFAGMIIYFVYFNAFTSKSIINNVHNSRLTTMAQKTLRGSIYTSDGEVIARSVENEDGSTTRIYPHGCTYAHVVGTSDINKSGIELSKDYSLITSNIHSVEKIVNEIGGIRSPGNNVITTLDSHIQQVAHDALSTNQGAVIAIEPSTGKVLAMVSKPDYDPNTLVNNYEEIISDENSKVLLNQATQGLFTPGSIFKVVTSLAYLRNGGSLNGYEYNCEGAIVLSADDGDTALKCYDGEVHGTLNLKESFAESCNSSFANISTKLPDDALKSTSEDLLFNRRMIVDFTTAISRFSMQKDASSWLKGATGIGQGDTLISPLHAALIASCIANDGTLMSPYVIDRVESEEGRVLEQTEAEAYNRLMTKDEAAILTDMMVSVVNEGTGYKLAGKSYQAAGKTGTAEVAGQGNNAWFIGFAPANDPKIAICVLVEDAGTGSSSAVPIAAQVFDAYLGN